MIEQGKGGRAKHSRQNAATMLAVCSVVAATVSVPALADPVGVRSWKDGEGAHISLAWPHAVKVESSVDGRELLLRFDRPVEGDALPGLTEQLPEWLDTVTPGYDTVLLRARQDVVWKVEPTVAEVTVNLSAVARAAPGAAVPLDARLGVQRARLLSQTGKSGEARTLLADLAARYPDNREVIAAQAEVETRAGRRSTALALLQQGLSQHPNDPTLTRARRDVLGAEGPGATLGTEYGNERNGEQYVSALAGVNAVALGNGITAGANAELRHLSAKNVVSSNGSVADFDQERGRAAIWVEAPVADQTQLRLTAYGATNTLGAGADVRTIVGEGEANAGVIYHQPFWESADAVVNNATVDTVTAGYGTDWGDWLSLMVQLRGSRYAQDGIAFVGASGGGVVEARLQPVDAVPQLRMVYGLDAEYFGHKITRVDNNGSTYVPLGLRSYEYHHAGLEWTEEELLVPELFGTLLAGYGIDRLGGDGAYYGVEGGYRVTPDAAILLYGNRNHVTTNGPRTVTTKAGATFLLNF